MFNIKKSKAISWPKLFLATAVNARLPSCLRMPESDVIVIFKYLQRKFNSNDSLVMSCAHPDKFSLLCQQPWFCCASERVQNHLFFRCTCRFHVSLVRKVPFLIWAFTQCRTINHRLQVWAHPMDKQTPWISSLYIAQNQCEICLTYFWFCLASNFDRLNEQRSHSNRSRRSMSASWSVLDALVAHEFHMVAHRNPFDGKLASIWTASEPNWMRNSTH